MAELVKKPKSEIHATFPEVNFVLTQPLGEQISIADSGNARQGQNANEYVLCFPQTDIQIFNNVQED